MGRILYLLAALVATNPIGPQAQQQGPMIETGFLRTGLDFPLLSGPTTEPAKPKSSPALRPRLQPRPLPPSQAPVLNTPVSPPVTETGPVLEPPLTEPVSSSPPTGVRLESPELNEVPLLDQEVALPDPIETPPALLQGARSNSGRPALKPNSSEPETLELDIDNELDDRPSLDLSDRDPAPKLLGRQNQKGSDAGTRNHDDLPLDFGTKRKGLLSRMRPGGAEPRSIIPAPRDPDLPSDADQDLAFRRQVDRAVRVAGAPHIKSQDILVKNRQVWIRLKADRFWNRRILRKSIESLPILSGYELLLDVE